MINSDIYQLFEKYVDDIKNGGTNQFLGRCPFPNHEDNKRSFSFNADGLYNCKGCGEQGNPVKFAKAMGENPKPFYSDDYKRTGGKQTGKAKRNNTLITSTRLKTVKNGRESAVNQRAMSDKTDINRHKKDLTPKLKEYEIKYPDGKGLKPFEMNHVGKDSDGAITIPYFDKKGRVIGIKHHKPKNGKQSWWEGDGKLKWYNAWWVESYKKDWLIVCEGEKDANRLNSLGYQAVSTSGGALSIPLIEDWFNKFKLIIILYDNDDAGYKGSRNCAEKIYRETGTLPYIGQWREGLPKGYDAFDDTTGEEIEFAMVNKILHKPKIKEGDITVMSLGALLESDYEEPEIIVSNILQQQAVTVFGGCSGTGKSWGALQMGMCIASGKSVFDYFEVKKPYKVLLCQFELTNGQMKERVITLKKSFDKEWKSIDQNFDYQIFSKKDAFTDRWKSLDRFLAKSNDRYKGGVIIFDNLYASVDTETDTSNNAQLIPVVKMMGEICEKYEVSLILVTHHKKGTKEKLIDIDDCLGGATLTRYASNVIQMKQSKLSTDLRVMEITKVRGEKSDLIEIPFKLRYNPDDGTFEKGEIINKESIHYIEAKDRWEIKLIRDMKNYESIRKTDEWSRADIWTFLSTEADWEQTQSNETKVTRFINRTVAWGLVKKVGHNDYRIVATDLEDD